MNESAKLIIFDVDGVLLNSEKIYLDMNQQFFKELGCAVSLEEHYGFVGMSATKMWTHLKDKFHLMQQVEELREMEKELKYKVLNQEKLVPTDYVIQLIEYFENKVYRLAIASSGLKRNIDIILKKLNIENKFELIVSGEDIINGKPAPDIFLKVSDYFGVKPSECIVIEDSANGIKAAKAAGMFCIGFYNPGSGNQNLSLADMLVDSFNDKRLYVL